MEKKRPLWRLKDVIDAAEIESSRAFTDAVFAFTTARSHAPDHGPSRSALCGLYWTRFLEAERAGEFRDAVHFRTLIERYDAGTYKDRLRGDGSLTVETFEYPCACLADQAAQVAGRASKKSSDASLPTVVPAGILDRLYDGSSPFRPEKGLDLGETPLRDIKLPMGSYLSILHKDGFEPVRTPFTIGRLEERIVAVTRYPSGSFPPGFRLVPGGSFPFQGEKNNPGGGAAQVLETGDVLVAKFPVLCGEYLGLAVRRNSGWAWRTGAADRPGVR